MKGYTNKDFNLGMTKTLVLGGSRVALFVPRLLGKISEKLILSPIAELITGISHEDLKQKAIAGITTLQNRQANEMQSQIDAGAKKIENWPKDKYGNVKDSFWYSANRKKLESLLSKQARLRTTPKKIMVAELYFMLMQEYSKRHTEQLAKEHHIERVKSEYERYILAIQAREQELNAAQNALNDLYPAFESFKRENGEVLGGLGLEEMQSVRENTGATISKI